MGKLIYFRLKYEKVFVGIFMSIILLTLFGFYAGLIIGQASVGCTYGPKREEGEEVLDHLFIRSEN